MILSRLLAAFAALITSTSASCLYGTSLEPRSLSADGHVPVSTFNYTGEGGPLGWVGLNPAANKECGHGLTQSPIVINSKTVPRAAKGSVTMTIPSVDMADFENLGSTVEVVVGGKLNAEGKDYELKQFHFHTPSEHRVDEEYFPMEIHFVFQSPSTKSIAVVAFLVELSPYGRCNNLLKQVFANLHQITTPGTITKTKRLDFPSVVNHLHQYGIYTYTGSLTTPPCSSKVSWYISATPILIDVVTFNAVKKVVKYNARYTQNILGEENLMEIAAHDIGCGLKMRAQPGP
ncbi:periplasmic alpha-carbonic anhydrase [Arthroderma uncinatum]|uniref:periplasmic alpha-carbonic anhydrase n=1 Tax=Arthroderma uncinatum TaxID=74035 RepID=UPI00144AD28F|nr:periplasmic alpha-carbonic anhydrase [Arthroderma uncinatum]KAF3481250.1 periplasmic alpha-carbonic anhydrase [Arthroderma uncinatum]